MPKNSYKTCLPDNKANQIVNKFKKIMKFSEHNAIFNLKESWNTPTNSEKSSKEIIGKNLGELINVHLKYKPENDPIHIQLAWRKNFSLHAMALVYIPEQKKGEKATLEFFDPTGYPNRVTKKSVPVDRQMHIILQSAVSVLKNVKFVNIQETNINPDGHCNSWSLFYHYLRNEYKSLSTEKFKQFFKANIIKNTQREMLGPVHNILSTSKLTHILNNLSTMYNAEETPKQTQLSKTTPRSSKRPSTQNKNSNQLFIRRSKRIEQNKNPNNPNNI